jgi:hypothetical protein
MGAGLEIWGAPFAMVLISLNLLRKNAAWKPERKAILGVIALPLVGWALFMGSCKLVAMLALVISSVP